jgi:phosphatidylinositol alpha-1,6-mannosyltransferase
VKVLALVTDGFGGHGGIALYTRNLLSALCSAPSHPRVVAVPRAMPLQPEPLPRNLTWDTTGLGGKRRFGLAVLRAATVTAPADLVLCTHVNLLPLAYPLAKVQRASLVLVAYGLDAKEPRNARVMRPLVGGIDALVSIRRNTTAVLASWAPLEGVPKYLLENAIDLSLYGIAPKAPDLVERFGLAGRRVVLTISRLGEQYVGLDEVLQAMPLVHAQCPDAVYVVAGDGPDLPRLRAKADALGVTPYVVFTGFVPEDRKADYYRLGDCYAMPGTGPDFDRYPLRFGFLEAMACGIPVVGAVCENAEERETDGALLAEQVDPHDTQAIARAVVTTLSRPKRIPPGLEKFGYPSFERRLHAIVDDVLARGRTGAARREDRPCT